MHLITQFLTKSRLSKCIIRTLNEARYSGPKSSLPRKFVPPPWPAADIFALFSSVSQESVSSTPPPLSTTVSSMANSALFRLRTISSMHESRSGVVRGASLPRLFRVLSNIDNLVGASLPPPPAGALGPQGGVSSTLSKCVVQGGVSSTPLKWSTRRAKYRVFSTPTM